MKKQKVAAIDVLNIEETYPAIPFLDIQPKASISYERNSCSSIFFSTLFTVARKWK